MKPILSCRRAFAKALTLALLLPAACSQDAVTDKFGPDPDPVASMTDLELLEYLGYDPQDATEYDLYYTVGDEIVSKERLDEIRREPQTRMQQDPHFGLVNRENQTVYIKDQFAGLMTTKQSKLNAGTTDMVPARFISALNARTRRESMEDMQE